MSKSEFEKLKMPSWKYFVINDSSTLLLKSGLLMNAASCFKDKWRPSSCLAIVMSPGTLRLSQTQFSKPHVKETRKYKALKF